MGLVKHRRMMTFSLDRETVEVLHDCSAATDIPMSRLVDQAVRAYLGAHEDPRETADNSNEAQSDDPIPT